jgi:prepilin-type N-terminal cleavage/methylation domain-containing protein
VVVLERSGTKVHLWSFGPTQKRRSLPVFGMELPNKVYFLLATVSYWRHFKPSSPPFFFQISRGTGKFSMIKRIIKSGTDFRKMLAGNARSGTICGTVGFSLIELLIVMAIMGILLVVTIPSVSSIGGSENLTKAAGDISTILEGARAYAMSHNTYVYVGVFEANNVPGTTTLQTSGTGRIFVATAASSDGSKGYSSSSSWAPANLLGVNRMQHFENVHMASVSQVSGFLTNMDSNANNDLDLSTVTAATPFSGTNAGMTAKANPVDKFSNVIQFSPDGSANIITSLSSTPNIPSYIQIGLVPAHGNQAASATNCAGIQIDGITGNVRVFRPGQP